MPFIQARARFTNGDGRVVTDASNNLNVNLFVTNGPSNGVNIEFQAGYANSSYILAINNSDSYIASDVANLIVDDPNGAVTVVPKTFGSDRYYEIISTGKAGIVTFGNSSNHKSFHIKDNYELPSGTAIKGFKSFGNLHINIAIEIKEHNFYVPNNISPTIEHIRFTTYPVSFGCHKFNDPNIVNWDVSNLKSMVNMFFRAEAFNQDLSGWCVPQFTSEPNLFANGSLLTSANKPVWGTCPVGVRILNPDLAGYYTTQTGGSVYNSFNSTATRYLRFRTNSIKAGTVLTLRAGPHSTPGSHYYTDFTVIQANGAIDSSNGVKTRMYGDGVPNKTITLTFTKDVPNPVEFIIAVNIYNVIYTMDRFGASCNNYVDANGVNILTKYASLHW